MTALIQAAEDLERVSVMFSGIVALGNEVRRVGSLQLAAEEAQHRIDDLVALHDKAMAEYAVKAAEAEKRLADTKEKHGALDGQMTLERSNIEADISTKITAANEQLRRMHDEGEKVMASARAQADLIIANTKTTAAALESQAKQTVDGFASQIEEKQGKVAGLDVAVKEAQNRLANINAQIAELRAKF